MLLKPKYLSSRERENHTAHLASIEAELDSQVTKVTRILRIEHWQASKKQQL